MSEGLVIHNLFSLFIVSNIVTIDSSFNQKLV